MNLRARLKLAAGAAALAVAGCGTTPSTVGARDATQAEDLASTMEVADLAVAAGSDLATTGSADLAGAPVDLARLADLSMLAAYPPGPYGVNVGEVIPNLSWVGYPDEAADAIATSKPKGAYSMQALHATGRAYGFVHISEVI
jgi:hypothetical protein